MITIKKYQIPIERSFPLKKEFAFRIELPRMAQILMMKPLERYLYNDTYIWARIDTNEPLEKRRFLLYFDDCDILQTSECLGGYCDTEIYINSFSHKNITYHLFENLGK